MTSDELAKVRHLYPDRPVIDAEIVSDADIARLKTQRGRAEFRRDGYVSDARWAVRATGRAVRHERTKAVARQVAYIPGGCRVVARWGWENWTGAGYARAIRDREAAGEFQAAGEMREKADAERQRRHERIMAYIRAPQELVKAVVSLTLLLVGGLLLLGIAAAITFDDPTLVTGPFRAILWALATLTWIFTVGGTLLVAGGFGLVVLALWAAGRRAGEVPDILAPAESRPKRAMEEITPSVVVTAFRDLGIPELRKRIAALPDKASGMVGVIRPAGCGVEFDATPPRGATDTGKILSLHARYAENLGRHPHEVHLSVPQNKPGTIRTWAAEPGALDEPIGPSPLVYDDEIKGNYRRGAAPWGVTLRGDLAEIRLYQIHILITGKSNQGKSASLRALALWLALDKRPELRIADLKGMNSTTKRSDWAMFEGIATEFIAGPTDDHVAAATEMLERVVSEMNRRIQQGGNWDPLVAIVDEAQVAYMCPAKGPDNRPYGGSKNTSRFLTAVRMIQNQGRAVDVLLWEGTQDPTNQNLPVLAREGAHLRICLAVGTEEKARMALGDNAVEGGAAPHRLRPGLDKGTLVVAGDGAPLSAGQASVTIRTHFIDDADAEKIADRAREIRGPIVPPDPDEVRDLVLDVHEALGEDDFVKATGMAARLVKLAPHYRPYRALNGTRLGEWLGREGVEVKDKDGVLTVRAERVLAELNRRQGVE